MTFLYQKLEQDVATWRESGYTHDEYSAIAEILDFASEDDGNLRLKEIVNHFREFPILPGPEERIKACIIGVN